MELVIDNIIGFNNETEYNKNASVIAECMEYFCKRNNLIYTVTKYKENNVFFVSIKIFSFHHAKTCRIDNKRACSEIWLN